ncbi:MAG TPA: hypothetical protein VIR60_00155 [Gammaproteobacteria bacterium]
MNPHTPRLHMGCGESLRSHLLLNLALAERKTGAASHKPVRAKPKRGRTRG